MATNETTEPTGGNYFTRDIDFAAFALAEGGRVESTRAAGRTTVLFEIELPDHLTPDTMAQQFERAGLGRFLRNKTQLLDRARDTINQTNGNEKPKP